MHFTKFCDVKDDIFSDVLKLLSSEILEVRDEQIQHTYSYWSDKFEGKSSDDFVYSKSVLRSDIEVPHNACYLGIDFPSWINYHPKKERLMLVGIDPLRNEAAFKGKDISEDMIIGTPFALHRSSMRSGRTKQYWHFLHLLSLKYSLYITDIFKLFYYVDSYKGPRSYNVHTQTAKSNIPKSLKRKLHLLNQLL